MGIQTLITGYRVNLKSDYLLHRASSAFTFLATMTMFSRTLARSVLRQSVPSQSRCFHQTPRRYNVPTSLNNILAGGEAPAVLIKTVSQEGIQLAEGLVIPSACIFLEGKTFLWDVPEKLWDNWTPEHFEIFDVVVPKPGEFKHMVETSCNLNVQS